jgi:hypothetical protein
VFPGQFPPIGDSFRDASRRDCDFLPETIFTGRYYMTQDAVKAIVKLSRGMAIAEILNHQL